MTGGDTVMSSGHGAAACVGHSYTGYLRGQKGRYKQKTREFVKHCLRYIKIQNGYSKKT
jgi:hypothetical protein